MTAQPTTEPGWQLAGNAAQAYQDHLVPVIFEPMAAALVAAAGVSPGDRVLDVACGTGVVARAAAQAVGGDGEVVGIDRNPDMLTVARDVASATGVPVRFEQAEAESLPFEDATFDVVLCQQALQFVTDRTQVLTEMRRVTRPDGRVGFAVLRSLEHHRVYREFVAALGRHAGPDAADMLASPFALGDGEQLRRDALTAGLDDVEVRIVVGHERFPSVEDMVWQEAASSPLAASLATLDAAAQAALVADLEQALAGHLDDAGVVFPNETHLVTARVPG